METKLLSHARVRLAGGKVVFFPRHLAEQELIGGETLFGLQSLLVGDLPLLFGLSALLVGCLALLFGNTALLLGNLALAICLLAFLRCFLASAFCVRAESLLR
jgi:hypothetical protein